MAPRYIVIGKVEDGSYLLMTRTSWVNKTAAEQYADTIHPSHAPIVVECPRGVDFREKP